jgi:hypothetical protein
VLADAHTCGFNPRDNRDELVEFTELQRLRQDVEADSVIEAGRLATLVRDVSKVLVNLGMPPIPEIPGIRAQPATSWRQWTSSWST